jgi:hypothetical protein
MCLRTVPDRAASRDAPYVETATRPWSQLPHTRHRQSALHVTGASEGSAPRRPWPGVPWIAMFVSMADGAIDGFWPILMLFQGREVLPRHASIIFDYSFDERVFRQVLVILRYDCLGLL